MGKVIRIAGMGLSGLMVNRGRSALSMLGIVIGVFAVILLTSLGNGVQEAITGKLNGVGSNLLTICPGTAAALRLDDRGAARGCHHDRANEFFRAWLHVIAPSGYRALVDAAALSMPKQYNVPS